MAPHGFSPRSAPLIMKTYLTLLLCLVFFGMIAPLPADVEKNDDGTYTVSGTWTFWPEMELLAPSGKENSFGEFKTVIFKQTANDEFNVRNYKGTFAVFKARARVGHGNSGESNLVVEQILEVIEGGVED